MATYIFAMFIATLAGWVFIEFFKYMKKRYKQKIEKEYKKSD